MLGSPLNCRGNVSLAVTGGRYGQLQKRAGLSLDCSHHRDATVVGRLPREASTARSRLGLARATSPKTVSTFHAVRFTNRQFSTRARCIGRGSRPTLAVTPRSARPGEPSATRAGYRPPISISAQRQWRDVGQPLTLPYRLDSHRPRARPAPSLEHVRRRAAGDFWQPGAFGRGLRW
jgi:hypothetical protein